MGGVTATCLKAVCATTVIICCHPTAAVIVNRRKQLSTLEVLNALNCCKCTWTYAFVIYVHNRVIVWTIVWTKRFWCKLFSFQIYYWSIGSNMVLRGAWTYKLSAHLRHNFKTVFFFSFLEMLRRFQWVFFRVEIAAIKLSNTQTPVTRVNSPISLKELPAESERLLSTPEYNV